MRKPLTGEPYAGKPPVRFGGRGGRPSRPLSTGLMISAVRPIRMSDNVQDMTCMLQKATLASNRKRNEGTPLKVEWFDAAQVNLSATERRAATLTTRRTVKKEYQAAWLVKALGAIDLTTLSGDDTPGRVHRLAAKARRPR